MNRDAGIGTAPVPLVDVAAQRRRLGPALDAAIGGVLEHCRFIMGPEVRVLEAQLAEFCGVSHAITTGSGTDALRLALMARGIGPGDAVLCPAFTFCATAEVTALSGAVPVFVDVDPLTFNLDPAGIAAGTAAARRNGLVPKGVIPVDLFGLPADYEAINVAAAEAGLFVVGDGAQSFGAGCGGARVGTLAWASVTSFFPSKPFGCYGDGGAVFTDDGECAGVIESLRSHGRGRDEYDNVRIGLNGRFDTIQAAVLIEKLKIFPEEIEARQRVARRYSDALHDVAMVPRVADGFMSVWAYYTIRVAPGVRDDLAADLRGQGISTAIYYPAPLHRQPAYRGFPVAEGGAPVSEQLAGEVISLPMHAYLDEPAQDRVIAAVRRALGG